MFDFFLTYSMVLSLNYYVMWLDLVLNENLLPLVCPNYCVPWEYFVYGSFCVHDTWYLKPLQWLVLLCLNFLVLNFKTFVQS
jgi:hypothetical protein